MSLKTIEIIVECEDGSDERCIENDGLLTIQVDAEGLTFDQIEQLEEEQDENGFVSRVTLEEIRETLNDEEWATETTCIYCGSDSDYQPDFD